MNITARHLALVEKYGDAQNVEHIKRIDMVYDGMKQKQVIEKIGRTLYYKICALCGRKRGHHNIILCTKCGLWYCNDCWIEQDVGTQSYIICPAKDLDGSFKNHVIAAGNMAYYADDLKDLK